MQVRTANAPHSKLSDSGIEVRPLGLRVTPVLDLTEDGLRPSGIMRGMRVLDLGCGAGDASLLIARLVGPTGLVVGIDYSAKAVDVAQRRATVGGQCYWMRFVTADPNTFVPHERFDAVVVRSTRLRMGERATFLRLSACVHPDGVIIVVSGKPTGDVDSNFHQIASRLSWPAGRHSARMFVSRHRSRRGVRRLLNVGLETK